MSKQHFITLSSSLWLALLIAVGTATAKAQTTQFTYQGKLSDAGGPASGTHDFQFSLFDTATVGTGTQLGTTQTLTAVAVSGGIFSVELDFGACPACFNGAPRYLEIAVKPTSGSTFTTLGPRQPLSSTPYAIKSLSAAAADGLSVACVNCVTSSQIASVSGSTVSGEIPVASVPAGSASYIQNTTSQQAASNFSISGDGTAGGTLSGSIVNAATQYNLNGLRAFTVNGAFNSGTTIFTASNTFVGEGAGLNTTPSPTLDSSSGKFNSFYGAGAGLANSTGASNSFFGNGAGFSNTTGYLNAFFGRNAGFSNTTSYGNAFFGDQAGYSNTTGNENAVFGFQSGVSNTTGDGNAFFGFHAGALNDGSSNAFFGYSAGVNNTTGNNNAFFGTFAGYSNTTGRSNTFIGTGAGFNASNPTGDDNTLLGNSATVNSGVYNGTAIGSKALVAQSNSLVLGSISGVNGATASTNVGIGTTAPTSSLHVVGAINATTQYNLSGSRVLSVAGSFNLFAGVDAGISNTTGGYNSFFGAGAGKLNTIGSYNSFLGRRAGEKNTEGSGNAFVGLEAGFNNATGGDNAFFGTFAGWSNTTGNYNTMIGRGANVAAEGLNNATAIGSNALVGCSNCLVLGSISGVNGATADTDVGIGTTSPSSFARLDVVGGSRHGVIGESSGGVGVYGINPLGYAGFFDGKVGVSGTLAVETLGSAGLTTLCLNGSNQIASCSSTLRYKTDVRPFSSGLDILYRLRPVAFTWKQGGSRDIGLAAEEVEKIEPLLVTYNGAGQVEGVKYDRLNVLLINAVKQQQELIHQQQALVTRQQQQIKQQDTEIQQHQQQIKQQQSQIDALKRLVCLDHPNAEICM